VCRSLKVAVQKNKDSRGSEKQTGRSALARSFYARPTVEVARALLGKIIYHVEASGGETSGRIVETEAYLGIEDAAAHTARGITNRTRVIFGAPGHAYVYLIYGMYECLNLVAEPEGAAGCVLIRALEPLTGLAIMHRRRPRVVGIEALTNGPGKLTRALGITRRHNGADVTRGPLVVCRGAEDDRFEIGVSPRVGLSKSADLPLRFFVEGNRFVSRVAPQAR
jgi:DNA-3-methyladenine glycosylase